jgi:hypothetical protein
MNWRDTCLLGRQEKQTMSAILAIIAVASLVPSVYAACGEVRDRIRSQRLQRELVRAFHG